ncbi:uncharacterized protein LOC114467692 isoform X2 [Gouania willdenowi]|uniref:uncharacterized protein LOC114467692 isoform X2 n=1 Tax=Gouania willdenowi TaxID=441366 RepID=UPI001056A9F8|nr:uncharacterized protein LOC114467692 isoform X2 [Gouania willdenowi]
MRVCSVLSVLCPLLSALLLEATTTCQRANLTQSDYGDDVCPVKLTSHLEGNGFYSVRADVWIKAVDFHNSVKVDVENQTLWPKLRKKKGKLNNTKYAVECCISCKRSRSHGINTSLAPVWKIEHEIKHVEAGKRIHVSYSATSTNCSATHTVPDPVPEFDLSVDHLSRSITVTVERGEKVLVQWCYQSPGICQGNDSPLKAIDPSINPTDHFNLPHLLPCICVQAYYTYTDARRLEKCPFKNGNLKDVSDVLRTSKVTTYESRVTWSSKCPSSELNVSASLCWMHHHHTCTHLPNSSLQKDDGTPLAFNTSAVDKHPQMCIQFSVQDNHNISCPYKNDTPLWEAYVGPGRQSLLVYITSSVQAKFSAQLCELSERACTPIGLPPHSIALKGNSAEMRISVPPASLSEKTCVEVWQSDPPLQGRRVICSYYAHNRRGIYAAVTLIIVLGAALLSVFLYRFITSRGPLYFQKPLLLVCSSDQSPHLTAVCALASVLQEQLGVSVHTSLWAQSSPKRPDAVVGVADVGPLPWLYGQWESICKAQGKMLMVWSPDARRIYEKCWDGGASVNKKEKAKHNHIKAGSRYKKTEVENARNACEELLKHREAEDSNDCCPPQRETSTVIEPVFTAALACLKGALQTCKGQGVAIVYFRGLGHNQDIPKALKCVPHYCLPQDFRGLIQELGECNNTTGRHQCHCWPRLLFKVLSLWLAQQLAKRLQTLLHQIPGVTPDQRPKKFLLPTRTTKDVGETNEVRGNQ